MPQIEGFQLRTAPKCHHVNTFTVSSSLLQAENNREGQDREGQDLFDYFDPLLSPHAYPNGIDAGPSTSESRDSAQPPSVSMSPPSQLEAIPTEVENGREKKDVNREGQDLFDYFDPLLSPHAYPNGIDAGASSTTVSRNSAPPSVSTSPPSSVGTFPSQLGDGKKKKVVGVLLMDHGSRNSASNVRLEKMAELYQMTSNHDRTDDDDVIVVEAAHMEIASPSIAEGLKKLLDQGVGK